VSKQPESGSTPAVDIKTLATLLSQCPEVTRLSTPGEDEPWALAHHLTDLAESFRVILDELLVKVVSPELDAAARYDALMDIGEELRHVMYHIKDARFYNYLEGSEG
jgi:hypothetical protein